MHSFDLLVICQPEYCSAVNIWLANQTQPLQHLLQATTYLFSWEVVRQRYERFWRAVAHSLLLSRGGQQLCPWRMNAHDQGDQDSRHLCYAWGKSHYVTQLYVLHVGRVMRMHLSPDGSGCILVTGVGSRQLDCLWVAYFSERAGQQWCNGYFIYCKQNFIFQLIAKYAIRHPGGLRNS